MLCSLAEAYFPDNYNSPFFSFFSGTSKWKAFSIKKTLKATLVSIQLYYKHQISPLLYFFTYWATLVTSGLQAIALLGETTWEKCKNLLLVQCLKKDNWNVIKKEKSARYGWNFLHTDISPKCSGIAHSPPSIEDPCLSEYPILIYATYSLHSACSSLNN